MNAGNTITNFMYVHPEAAFQLELFRRRRAKLARSYTRQQQQPQAQLRGGIATAAVVTQLKQECRHFAHAQVRIVRDGWPGYHHDIEVSCRIVGKVYLNHRVPEKLVEPGSTLRCHGEGITPLDLAQNLQQIGTRHLENRPLAQIWQDVLREDPVDLRECALTTRLYGQRPDFEVAP